MIILNSWSQQLAFPTAEGYGKYATGGRGGTVYEVTNSASNVIIRYIRVRANPTAKADAGKWWLSDNVVEGYAAVTADNWKGFASSASYFRLSEPWNGMPDSWEKDNGLDTANVADRNNVGPDGYTMLENYLNSLAVYTPVSVTGLTFASAQDSVEKNKQIQLYPIISPSDATNQIVTWSSTDSTVAIANGSGIVRGIDNGTAIITATTKDGGFIAECTVEVISALDQKSSEHEILVYPNPFTKNVIVYFEGMNNVNRLEVLNITGQVIKALNKDELKAAFVELNLDIPGNIFLVRINTDEKVYTKKIIRK